MKYNSIIYTILLFSFLGRTGFSQNSYFKQYTYTDGLPSMTTYKMVQDKNGILWIGTENGLVSFDGEVFTTYTHPDLKDNDIIVLHLNKDGEIMFFNLANQLGKIVNGKIEILISDNFVLNVRKYNLLSTSSSDYIMASELSDSLYQNKIYELEDNNLKVFVELITDRKKNGLGIAHPQNSIYYSIIEDSLHLFKYKNRLEYDDKNDHLFNLFDYVQESEFSINYINLATFEDEKIILLDNNQYYFVNEMFYQKYHFSDVQRIVVYEDKYYVILHDRLDVYYPKTNESIVLLDNIIVNTVFEDNEENLWISTRNRGLLKINHQNINIRSFTHKEKIISQIQATEDYVLILWDDEFEIRNKQNEEVFFIDLQSNKECVIMVFENTFYVSSLKQISWITPPDFTLHNSTSTSTLFKSLAFKDSYLYGGRTNRIHKTRFEPNKKEGDLKMELLSEVDINRAYVLKYSKNQNIILAGTSTGLYKIDDQDNTSIYINELSKSNISDIVESADSSFWVATKTEGIYRIKNEQIIDHYDTSNSLLSNVINEIVIQDQYLYAATSNGIAQINMNTSKTINKNSFNGLPSDVINSLCIFNDSIWLAIEKEIAVIDSSFFHYDNMPSVLVMKEFYCNNKLIEFENGIKLNHDENKIDILLNNVSLSSGANKSIKYRIQNVDTTWTTSRESAIRLPALQPGKYVVEAIGVNAVGTESKVENFMFEIKPPWWKTGWARIISFLILIGIVNMIIIYRGRRIRKEETVKRDYLSQINKIKDQALQLQMNPHFIFNSLNAIQGFIGTDEEEMAMNYLARFARLIRLIFEHSKDNSISLEEELEFINLYLDLEKLRFKDKVTIQITIDPKLDGIKDMIKVPPLLIQPIVENSFKHGLFHKKGKGLLKIDYTAHNEILQVIIEDDGIGRAKSSKIAQKNTEKHISSGIKTTVERIDLLNFGKDKKLNSTEIIDLYDEEGNATGTRTILKLEVLY